MASHERAGGAYAGSQPVEATALIPLNAKKPSADFSPAWFCIRSQPKHEHIAAAHLKKEGIEVFLPRIRFRRSTRQGPVWFTEALFPSYLFARFDLSSSLRKVHHARGVTGVVHFGDQWSQIPDASIQELRATVGSDELHVVQEELKAGEEVVISGGAFHDLRAVVTRALPARARVAVLLNFLGRQTMVEVSAASLIREGSKERLLKNKQSE